MLPHWTEHFVNQGFAVCRGLVDRNFCEEAVRRVKAIVKNDRSLHEWNTDHTPVLHRPYFQGATGPDPVLGRIYEQPRLLVAIEELFGGPGHWDGERNFYLFVKPYDPKAKAVVQARGHIDFPGQEVPILYRGFTWQVLLADTEPFGGNLSVHPGSHRVVQKALMDDPALQFPKGTSDTLPLSEPFEFIGEAGDVLFMHHLVFHSGNESHSARKLPRLALHAEAFRSQWLGHVDPSDRRLGPWERSLSLNGAWEERNSVERENIRRRREYIENLRSKEDGLTSP